jgi:RNA polymerase sigma-70 factor (ECF subfamily)
MAAEPDEAALIQSVLDGRTEAFAELVRTYQDQVFGLCVSLLKNAAEAEDAAQEIFLKAYQKLSSFRRESSFATWLYRIAYHRCLDVLKAHKRRVTDSLDRPENEDAAPLAEQLAEPVSAAAQLEDRETAARLLAELPPDYRAILTLREMQGLSYEEELV